MAPDTSPSQPRRRGAGRQARQRASLSLEQIVATAIATLDRDGAEKLTLRSLAAELGSGVASLYWYASGKEELMGIVADELLGRALAQVDRLAADGREAPPEFAAHPAPAADRQTSAASARGLIRLRRMVLCLFVQMIEHRWLAGQLVKAGPDQENSLMFWERIGQVLQGMELTVDQQFHASIAVVNYASGMGVEISQTARDRAETDDPAAMFTAQVEEWESLSEERFPFVRSIIGAFVQFDDASEFIAGLDLLLAGIERQTWADR